MCPELERLKVKIFADGADLGQMLRMSAEAYIRGFTTNPSLVRKAGVSDYRGFFRAVLDTIRDRPISVEVFADEPREMEAQAREIASWGSNVNVKIPVTNCQGESTARLVRALSRDGIKVNVTAMMTLDRVREFTDQIEASTGGYISVFAGRIADTGRDPLPLMAEAARLLDDHGGLELIWASPREMLNLFQADQVGCHVITVSGDILKKIPLLGRNLDDYSLETVRSFFEDGRQAGYAL